MSIANFATVVIIAIHDHCCASKGCCACLKWVGTMSIGYKKQSNGIATGMDTKNKHRDVVLLFLYGNKELDIARLNFWLSWENASHNMP